jgi:hypothetical protein
VHLGLEAVGMARLGEEGFGFGDVIRVLRAVELSPAGQLGNLLRRPAWPCLVPAAANSAVSSALSVIPSGNGHYPGDIIPEWRAKSSRNTERDQIGMPRQP